MSYKMLFVAAIIGVTITIEVQWKYGIPREFH